MNTPPNTVCEGGQKSAAVHVRNIPNHVEVREVISLFRTLIGKTRTSLEITFYQHEIAIKALCMNGYSLGGVNLDVSYIPSPPSRSRRSVDDRRNLYVLGLPFALTKGEFAALFSRYGTVVHCVILATVDNSSRRRGFIVMSSHEEAKRALSNLTRAQIKGHTIDVSWAVVQRSQGFLDGGDRVMLLDSRAVQLPETTFRDGPPRSSSGSDFSDYSPMLPGHDRSSLVSSPIPTSALLIHNLPALFFSQPQDLRPLLCPFGAIERIRTIPMSDSETVSAVVQYTSIASAVEARNSLNGQCYHSMRRVEVQFVNPNFGEQPGDLRLNPGPALRKEFDDVSSYPSSRDPSPFSSSGSLHSMDSFGPRPGYRDQFGPSRSAINTPYPQDFPRHPTYPRSRDHSPRDVLYCPSNQPRRIQGGGFNPASHGFAN
ncbi:hypothetical protein BKA70DRAFT_1245435 [Coprinopsis sp. MPI-PUGE-AT-0042]|nr:hypothetical protein BKA70DRAFT_1245435 [Coprinopsis sp. MPI-PUGE-AT-0042]